MVHLRAESLSKYSQFKSPTDVNIIFIVQLFAWVSAVVKSIKCGSVISVISM